MVISNLFTVWRLFRQYQQRLSRSAIAVSLLLGLIAAVAVPRAAAGEAGLSTPEVQQLREALPANPASNPFTTPPVPRNIPRPTAAGPVCQAMQPTIGNEAYSIANFRPEVSDAWAHPTNFGDRVAVDRTGQPVDNRISLIVLHETVGSADSTINFFQTPHPRDEDQASYHALIRRNGTIVNTVPPDKRAFGAGLSNFRGEAVRLNPRLPGSVNNFSLHVSLESPSDGRDNRRQHSGYTPRQYDALAQVVQQWMTDYAIPGDRITTHAAVDQSRSRMDPRSFQWPRLAQRLQVLNDGDIPGCTTPVAVSQ